MAIIYKSYFQVNLIEEGETRSFQFAKRQVRLNSSNNQVVFIVIYHPPYSLANLTTTAQFLVDFTNWLLDQFLQMNNNIVLDDFNIYDNKIDSDENGNIFMETTEAPGLHQHVQFGTHICDKTLDLIFTEAGSCITIRSCIQGPYISDHCIINCSTTIPAEDSKERDHYIQKVPNILTQRNSSETSTLK